MPSKLTINILSLLAFVTAVGFSTSVAKASEVTGTVSTGVPQIATIPSSEILGNLSANVTGGSAGDSSEINGNLTVNVVDNQNNQPDNPSTGGNAISGLALNGTVVGGIDPSDPGASASGGGSGGGGSGGSSYSSGGSSGGAGVSDPFAYVTPGNLTDSTGAGDSGQNTSGSDPSSSDPAPADNTDLTAAAANSGGMKDAAAVVGVLGVGSLILAGIQSVRKV
jgi:hypothetical protein